MSFVFRSSWYPEDIMAAAEARGHDRKMSFAEAEEWFKEHESAFRNLLNEAGNEILAEMLALTEDA